VRNFGGWQSGVACWFGSGGRCARTYQPLLRISVDQARSAYRATEGIDQGAVKLAAIVRRAIQAEVDRFCPRQSGERLIDM
jgi:hypothetical protein